MIEETYVTRSQNFTNMTWGGPNKYRNNLMELGGKISDIVTKSATEEKITMGFDVTPRVGVQYRIKITHRNAPTEFEKKAPFRATLHIFGLGNEVDERLEEMKRMLEGQGVVA